jgi:hypothetical protein
LKGIDCSINRNRWESQLRTKTRNEQIHDVIQLCTSMNMVGQRCQVQAHVLLQATLQTLDTLPPNQGTRMTPTQKIASTRGHTIKTNSDIQLYLKISYLKEVLWDRCDVLSNGMLNLLGTSLRRILMQSQSILECTAFGKARERHAGA